MTQKIMSKPSTPEYEASWDRIFSDCKEVMKLHEECGDTAITEYHIGKEIVKPALQEIIDECDREAFKDVFGLELNGVTSGKALLLMRQKGIDSFREKHSR